MQKKINLSEYFDLNLNQNCIFVVFSYKIISFQFLAMERYK